MLKTCLLCWHYARCFGMLIMPKIYPGIIGAALYYMYVLVTPPLQVMYGKYSTRGGVE